jgi:acyl-coenzyme A synthetase/AMP-(fatty) acid ligase
MAGMTVATALTFATSGSTGAPVAWQRTAEQVRAEAVLLAELCGTGGVDGIVCYPPPVHLYGYLMGRALPELLGVPVRPIGLTDPPAPAFAGLRRPLVAALPAALGPLRRCLPVLRRLDRLTLVHSSAMLPVAATRLLDHLGRRARLVELFGSTETGLVATRLVATRREPHRPIWTLAPDVRFGSAMPVGREGQLRVRSPRIAAQPGQPPPTEYELDDIVEVVDERTFRWVGRSSRLVKVNGRRVNLDQVTDVLRDAVPDMPIICRPHPDELRGEWFAVLVGDPRAVPAVATACRQLPSWQRPSAIRPITTEPH